MWWKRVSKASWVRPRWDLSPRMVWLYRRMISTTDCIAVVDVIPYLSTSRDPESGQQTVSSLSSTRSQNTFYH